MSINSKFNEFVLNNKNWKEIEGLSSFEVDNHLDTMSLQAQPVFLKEDSLADLKNASEKVFDLIKDMPNRFFQNDEKKLSEFYKIPIDRIEQFFGRFLESDHLVSRGDFVLSDNQYKCIEFNIATNIGGIENYQWASMYEHMPEYQNYCESIHLEAKVVNTLQELFKMFIKALDNNKNQHILIVYENDLTKKYIEYFQESHQQIFAKKSQLFFARYKELSYKDSFVYFKDKKINLIYEFNGCLTSPELLDAQFHKNVILCNGPRSILFSHKFNLALLSENSETAYFSKAEQESIKKYIPWTRIVQNRTVQFHGKEHNLRDLLKSVKDSFVLKHGNSYNGKAVVIGKSVSDSEWDTAIDTSIASGEWIAQEFYESDKLKFINKEYKEEEYDLLFQPFVFDSVYSGVHLRVAPITKKGRITTDSSAKNVVLFEYKSELIKEFSFNKNVNKSLFDTYAASLLTNPKLKDQHQFWLTKFPNNINYFYFDSGNLKNDHFIEKSYQYHFEHELSEKILKLCKNSEQLQYLFFLAVLSILMKKYSSKNKLIVASTIQKSSYAEGLINGILPVIIELNNDLQFKELLKLNKSILNETYNNQEFPIKEFLTYGASQLRFNSALILDSLHDKEYFQNTKSELLFLIKGNSKDISLELSYNSCIYTEELIKEIISDFVQISYDAVNNIERPVIDFKIENTVFNFKESDDLKSNNKRSLELFLSKQFIFNKMSLIEGSDAYIFLYVADQEVSKDALMDALKFYYHSELRIAGMKKVADDDFDKMNSYRYDKLLNLDSQEISEKPRLKSKSYDVSAAQKRFWMIDQIQGSSLEYHLPIGKQFSFTLQTDVLIKAIEVIVKRHEILRTSFSLVDNELKQIISDNVIIDFKESVYQDTNDLDDIFSKALHEENTVSFSLSEQPLFRVKHILFENHSSILIYTFHHIISDGTSLNVFYDELLTVYQSHIEQKELYLEELEIQYKDFAVWQNKQLDSDDTSKRFWLKSLSGELPILNLPYDGLLNQVTHHSGNSFHYIFDKNLTESITKFASKNQASLYMILLAAFNVLLSKLTAQNDILIGSPVAGREHESLEKSIGCFINTIVLRNYLEDNESFIEFLEKVKHNTVSALEHQSYPFEELVNHLDVKRDIMKYPVTSVYFNMMNFSDQKNALSSNKSNHKFNVGPSLVNLNVYIKEQRDEISFSCVYKNELFTPSTIELIFNKYQEILSSIVANPSQKIREIKTSKRERNESALSDMDWYGERETVVSVFEKQAERFKDRLAVKSSEKTYTYKDLNEEANQWAELISKEKGDYLALFISHDEKIPLGILSTLKAGKAYVPIDPAYPEARIKNLLKQIQASVVLTDDANRDKLASLKLKTKTLNLDDKEAIKNTSKENVERKLKPSDKAYILFTSGSTGEAKGIIQSHEAILHYASQYSRFMDIKQEDRLTGLFTYNHDSSNSDIYGALVNGACYYPLAIKYGLSLEEIQKRIKEEKLTIYHSSPAVFRLLSEKERFDSLRKVKMAGEAVRRSDFERFKETTSDNASFIVSYGSTESTLNLMKELKASDEISRSTLVVGKELARTELSIRNEQGEELSDLEQGEIYVHSPYLSKSYLNNEAETKNRFIKLEHKNWYKTGDIGRRLATADYEILGRADGQVKVRGNRIELSEIENHLLAFPEIKSAVVCIKEKNNEDYLAGYLTTINEEEVDLQEIRSRLSKKIPDYMIPEAFLVMDALPLTASGKVDRKSLPEIELKVGSENYIAANTETEKKLTGIWEEVLGKEKIGIRDNFFELGGHSLKAMQVISRINRELNVDIAIQESV
jgi:amino acid adenylation domain-containing protein